MQSTEKVLFYAKSSPWWEFSNYYELPKKAKFVIDNREYTSTEHYFQSMKFRFPGASARSVEYSEKIRLAKTPEMCRILANQKKHGGYKWKTDLNQTITEYSDVTFDTERWDNVKDNVMRRAVFQKFNNVPHLTKLLMSTKASEIYEASPRDSYWGLGKDNTGKNMLGKILQEVRYILSGGILLTLTTSWPSYDKAHWIIPDVLLASAYPGTVSEETHDPIIEGIEDMGIDSFVSLQTHDELVRFRRYDSVIADDLPSRRQDTVCYTGTSKTPLFFSILEVVDRKAVATDELAVDMCNAVTHLIALQRKVVVHCFGGKGRTGELSCLIFGKIYGMSAEEAMKTLQYLYDNTRQDKGRKIGNIPQTAVQNARILSSGIFDT